MMLNKLPRLLAKPFLWNKSWIKYIPEIRALAKIRLFIMAKAKNIPTLITPRLIPKEWLRQKSWQFKKNIRNVS